MFSAICQKPDKKIRKKGDDRVCFDRIDQFYTYFFSLLATSFVIGEIPQPCMAEEKIFL